MATAEGTDVREAILEHILRQWRRLNFPLPLKDLTMKYSTVAKRQRTSVQRVLEKLIDEDLICIVPSPYSATQLIFPLKPLNEFLKICQEAGNSRGIEQRCADWEESRGRRIEVPPVVTPTSSY